MSRLVIGLNRRRVALVKNSFYAWLLIVSSGVVAVEAVDPALQVVSKKISLGRYKPSDLVTFEGVLVSKRIIPDLKKLLQAAHKDGLRLKVMSGYRSYDRQAALFDTYVKKERQKDPSLTMNKANKRANTYSALAGHSEHQLGTTVDVLSEENGYIFSSDKPLRYAVWLEKNAHRYNFNISYRKDSKEYIYEPWHIRWYPKGHLPTQNSLNTKSSAASLIDLPVSSLKVESASCK